MEEKKRKREEQRKAEAAKRAAKGGKGAAAPPPPPDDGCIIDRLLQEIRDGTTLRTSKRPTLRRNNPLSTSNLKKLQDIASKGEAAASLQREKSLTNAKADSSEVLKESAVTSPKTPGKQEDSSPDRQELPQALSEEDKKEIKKVEKEEEERDPEQMVDKSWVVVDKEQPHEAKEDKTNDGPMQSTEEPVILQEEGQLEDQQQAVEKKEQPHEAKEDKTNDGQMQSTEELVISKEEGQLEDQQQIVPKEVQVEMIEAVPDSEAQNPTEEVAIAETVTAVVDDQNEREKDFEGEQEPKQVVKQEPPPPSPMKNQDEERNKQEKEEKENQVEKIKETEEEEVWDKKKDEETSQQHIVSVQERHTVFPHHKPQEEASQTENNISLPEITPSIAVIESSPAKNNTLAPGNVTKSSSTLGELLSPAEKDGECPRSFSDSELPTNPSPDQIDTILHILRHYRVRTGLLLACSPALTATPQMKEMLQQLQDSPPLKKQKKEKKEKKKLLKKQKYRPGSAGQKETPQTVTLLTVQGANGQQ